MPLERYMWRMSITAYVFIGKEKAEKVVCNLKISDEEM